MAAGSPILEDRSLVQEGDPMCHVAGEPHLVGRDHHRHALFGELADRVEHLRDEHRVERARHLVQEEDVRLHRKRPHDRDALLLAPGKPIGVLVGLVLEAEPLEEPSRPVLSIPLPHAEHLGRRQGHVAQDRHVGEEVEGLEDDPDPPADGVDVDVPVGNLSPFDPDATLVDVLEQVDAPQEGRLPGATRTDQTDDLVVRDLEVDPAQHLQVIEGLPEPLDTERGPGHAVVPAIRRRRSRWIM